MSEDDAELAQFYEQWAANRAANVLEQEYVRIADEWKWATLRPLIVRFLPEPRSILEFGCGSGDMLALAATSFPKAALYGIDLSERMIAMAKARLPGATLVVGDLRTATELPARVDVGLAADILEHLTDPVPAARALGARAELVALKIPLKRPILRFGLPKPVKRGADHPAGHLHFWTLDESRALLAAAGLEVLAESCADPPEHIRYHPGIMPSDSGTPAKFDSLRALRAMHRVADVAFEKWSCKRAPVIHRAFYGSNHFAVCRRMGASEGRVRLP